MVRPLSDFDLDLELYVVGDFELLLDLRRVDSTSSGASAALALVLSFPSRSSARRDFFGELDFVDSNLGGAVESRFILSGGAEPRPLLLIQSPSPNFFRLGDLVNSDEADRDVESVESRLCPLIQLLSFHFFLGRLRSQKTEFDSATIAMVKDLF